MTDLLLYIEDMKDSYRNYNDVLSLEKELIEITLMKEIESEMEKLPF